MKKLITLLMLIPAIAWADPPCTEQNYSNPDKEPNWRCPGPGESILLPDIKFNPSVGLGAGASYQKSDSTGLIKLAYPVVLMDKDKVMQLGLRIQGLRRLRWLDLHKGAEVLKIEKKHTGAKLQAKLDLEKTRSKTYKVQRDDARHQRDQARKWYRSWTFGFVVGIVTTSAAAVAVAYAASR